MYVSKVSRRQLSRSSRLQLSPSRSGARTRRGATLPEFAIRVVNVRRVRFIFGIRFLNSRMMTRCAFPCEGSRLHLLARSFLMLCKGICSCESSRPHSVAVQQLEYDQVTVSLHGDNRPGLHS